MPYPKESKPKVLKELIANYRIIVDPLGKVYAMVRTCIKLIKNIEGGATLDTFWQTVGKWSVDAGAQAAC